MSKRKGELTSAGIDLRWPHQVALLTSLTQGVDRQAIIADFCAPLSKAPRGHFVQFQDQQYFVHCFATREDAQTFMDRFGGEWFDPSERGRGANWSKWYKGRGRCR